MAEQGESQKIFDYWVNLYSLIDVSEAYRELPAEPHKFPSFATDFFDKGIILLINLDNKNGKEFLKKAAQMYRKILNYQAGNTDDYSRYFFTSLITTNEPHWDLLRYSVELKEKQVLHEVEFARCKDIYVVIKNTFYDLLVDMEERIKSNLTLEKASDKYPYEAVADQLIYLSRRNLLMGEAKKSKDLAADAIKLYNLARERIPGEYGKKSGKKKKKQNSEVFFDEVLPTATARTERDGLLGNIPLFMVQATLLQKLGSVSMEQGTYSDKDVKKDIENFFRTVINPPDRKISSLGCLEEVEWAFIRKIFYPRFYGFDLRGEWGQVLKECFLAK